MCGSAGHAATTHTCCAHETFMIQLEWNELCHNEVEPAAAKYQPAALNSAINSDDYCRIALHSQVIVTQWLNNQLQSNL